MELDTETINITGMKNTKYTTTKCMSFLSLFYCFRNYCTRKLFRLRRSLKQTNGTKRYVKKEIKPDSIDTERYFLIPLYQAERAWAYAMQLKDEVGPNEVPPRKYFHIVRKLAKAVHWCNQLTKLASDLVDDKTNLEIEVNIHISIPFFI